MHAQKKSKKYNNECYIIIIIEMSIKIYIIE